MQQPSCVLRTLAFRTSLLLTLSLVLLFASQQQDIPMAATIIAALALIAFVW